ncbi:Hypothetical predicted protein [Marmota monax]|uniref:Uncharacterized protein n=1 Tax=Marmota monax TaxID=9995 RepID=A0A5E4B7J5_MARMO|nr:hypothetical protein GHT09_020014 [Marmota monax]VTJ65714.1 Hypothetical predicted protein [Marmota monax]
MPPEDAKRKDSAAAQVTASAAEEPRAKGLETPSTTRGLALNGHLVSVTRFLSGIVHFLNRA